MSNSQSSPPLIHLINLSRQARKAESALALQFIVVNETFSLAPYTIACLWVQGEGVVGISGVSQVDRHSAFSIWLSGLCEGFFADHREPVRIDAAMLNAADRAEWRESLPSYALWIPSGDGERGQVFGLLLARNEPWRDDEIAVIAEWADIWRHSWEKLHAPSAQSQLGKVWHAVRKTIPSAAGVARFFADAWRGLAYVAKNPGQMRVLLSTKEAFDLKRIWQNKRQRFLAIALLAAVFPIKLTVFAPGELVPANPAVIRVPIEGVVGEFFVSPNQKVNEGDLLFQLDLTSLQARLQVAQQETQIAAAELRQSTLQSLSDQKSKRNIAPQEGKAIERRLEAEYLQWLLSKAKITAPRSGVAIFDDPSEWIGRPVAAGERVMVVASEGETEIEAWISIGDAIELSDSAQVTLYLNAAPLSPVTGTLRYFGHEAQKRPDGSYAYRLRATIPKDERHHRVGLKGTARVSGQWVPFAYWVLRKPIGWLRQFVGI